MHAYLECRQSKHNKITKAHTQENHTHTHTQKELSDARTKKTRIEWLTAGMQHIRTEPNSMCRSICVYDFDKAQVLTMHF